MPLEPRIRLVMSCAWISALLLAHTPTSIALSRHAESSLTLPYNEFGPPLDYDDDDPPEYFQGVLPEDVRFAKLRCTQNFPLANLNWAQQTNMSAAMAQDTHCYVKCFLRQLGLIHLKTLGWNLTRMRAIWRNFRDHVTFPPYCQDLLKNAYQLSGKCVDYYNEWMLLHNECEMQFRYTFYEQVNPNKIPFIISLGPWRKRGISAIDFCTLQLHRSKALEFLPLCVYQQFHYFDGYGRIDLTEITKSFAEVALLTVHNFELVKQCVHRTNSLFFDGQNGNSMAHELYNCLSNNMPTDYAKVHAHRNLMTHEY